MKLVLDIEADALEVSKVTNIWCVVCKDVDNGSLHTFVGDEVRNELPAFLSNADAIFGHNIIGYDYPVLERFIPGALDPTRIYDTLVLSRLLKYNLDDGQGHSLEAWGQRLDCPKAPSPDFSKFSDEMLEYCIQDVEVNTKLYEYLREHLSDECFAQAIETETAAAWICEDMHNNGFKYDIEKANEISRELEERLAKLDEEITKGVGQRLASFKEYTPRLTKSGTISRSSIPRGWTDLRLLHPGCPFSVPKYESFNPNSYPQLKALLDKEGWKPTELTKTGKGYKINEVNLATLPETASTGAKKLVERLLISARVRTLKEWKAAYDPNTGRIHGRFAPIGTWTGRMSHSKPNMGNIAAKKTIKYKSDYLRRLALDYGGRMRSLWICDADSWLVGTDMEAAHVRLFAHYINDVSFTRAVTSGDKKNGTDVHSLGAKIFSHLGCDRDNHKTFIFSFFNGAGPPKVAEIFGCSLREARKALQLYQSRYPGLDRLRSTLIPKYAADGYFVSLDGRRVVCGEAHPMFAGMLQAGEAIVMKMANVIWRRKLREQGIKFKQVNLVHDEFVTEVYGDRTTAELVGRIQSDAIREVGEILRLNCPLAGEYKIGRTWLEVH